MVLINSPEYAHKVLVEHANDVEKSPMLRQHLQPLLGNGLLSSDNRFHRRQRKLLAPAFQHGRIVQYAAVMAEYAERMHSEWADGAIIDVFDEMMRLTLWITGKTLFDANLLDEASALRKPLDAISTIAEALGSAVIRFPSSWPTPRNQGFRRAIGQVDATIYRLIEARRQSKADQGDVLSILLYAHDEDDGSFMTNQQVRDEAITLFLAGHGTVTTALAWTWYLLMQYPTVYNQLRTEVDGVLGGRTPTYADLPNLPYTLQIFKEALRLYPPAWVILRQAKRPIALGPYHIPAGMRIAISPYTLHRRSDYFPYPEHFEPRRFAPEAEAHLPRCAYLPFGAGPRICIGNHFALLEGHLILATLVQRVIFTLVPGQNIEQDARSTLTPRHGIKAVVRRRTLARGGPPILRA